MEEIRRSIRDEPPTHYTLEIPSFSLLSKSLMERKLGLYPNGDKARNGQDHISLYLVLSETNSLPPSFEVTALFRFFVFHQIHGNYLTLEGRCFLSVTREWGFAQLIDLQTFKDPSNGYLVNDTCCFGVEVFICKERNIRKGERLSLISPSDFPNCTWKIENFSKLEEEFYHSDEFCAADRKWKMKLYPKGDSNGKGNSISLYLLMVGKSPDEKVYVEGKLRVLDQFNENHHESPVKQWFVGKPSGWGYHKFMKLSVLNKLSKGFLVNDTCIFEADVSLIGVINSLS
uniref:MATH domain-containing protein n=1 Tax=Nelumbo nucifera TaxID=4432 RepID=A0A822ZP78_NELNU|nr:TPA_asm: hypothetical protein HUJ06_003535 [Nelumbo nucifera]